MPKVSLPALGPRVQAPGPRRRLGELGRALCQEGCNPTPGAARVRKPASSQTEGWGHPSGSESKSLTFGCRHYLLGELEQQTAREKGAAHWKTRVITGLEGGKGRCSSRTRPSEAVVKNPALRPTGRTQSTGLAELGARTASPGFPPRRRADASPLPGGPSPQAAKSGARAAGPRWPERFLGWSGPSPDGRGIAWDQGHARLRFSEGPTRLAALLLSPTPWERENNGRPPRAGKAALLTSAEED